MSKVVLHVLRIDTKDRQEARAKLLEWLASQVAHPEIVASATGKPRLADGQGHFSFSYRLPWAAAAYCREAPVGVDIEVVKPFADMDGVALEFFPEEAAADFAATPESEAVPRFFYWWTRIEAAVKATGEGLDASRDPFAGVTVESVDVSAGIAVAVAVLGDSLTVERVR